MDICSFAIHSIALQDTNVNIFQTGTGESEAAVLVVDDSLNTQTASSCELLVGLDEQSIQLALKEKKNNRILALESFQFSTGKNVSSQTEQLEKVSRNSHLLRNYGFTRAVVGVFSKAYSLIPDALYRSGDEHKFLEFNFSIPRDYQKILSRHIHSLGLHLISGIQDTLQQEIMHLFENPVLIHSASALLEGVVLQSRGKKERALYLHVRNGNLDIMVAEGKKLLLMNSFPCQTPDDILYFSLMVCDQLELDPDSVSTSLAGQAEKESATYKILYRYFRNLQFVPRPANINFSYRFDQFPVHKYFSLFSLGLCES